MTVVDERGLVIDKDKLRGWRYARLGSAKYCPENRSPPDRFSEAICLENFLDPQDRLDVRHFFPTFRCAWNTK